MVGTDLSSGTKTYNLNFCKYLDTIILKEDAYIFLTKNYLKEIPKSKNPKITYIVKSNIFSNVLFRLIWMQFFLPFELKKLKIEKFFSPMNLGPIFLGLFNIKFILALHSNLPWIFFTKMPGNYIRNYLMRLLMKISINNCDKLIVASDYAKQEIVEVLKINQEKVISIYLGIDSKYLVQYKDEKNLDLFDYNNYILSVVSCVKYHNIINLLKAFKLLKRSSLYKLKFVLIIQVLDRNYFLEIKKYVKTNFKKNEIIFYHNLHSDYLINLYKKAKFYIFSSYCEVFGFTSLEAMSQRCPVLISKKSALPEINSDSAGYFDPDNVENISVMMKKIISNIEYRNNLIDKGNIRHKKFDWSKTVGNTIKIIEKL